MPRVFQLSCVTAVVAPDGGSLFVGAVELRHFRSFSVSFDSGSGKSSVVVEYDELPDDRMAVEEEKRTLVASGWIARVS